MNAIPANLQSLSASVPRLQDYFGIWAIEESAFRAHVEFANRINLHAHVLAHVEEQKTGKSRSSAASSLFQVVNDVAIVQLHGTMMKQQSSFGQSTSTVFARRQIRSAARRKDIQAILYHIDSPGGTVAGTNDLADDMFDARQRKPTAAFIEDLGASAAYWAASQAGQVFMNPSGSAGAIGTFAVIYDMSRAAKNDGFETHVIKAGRFKGLGTPGSEITPEQLEMLQERVDQLNEFFIQSVARGRGMSLNQVRELADGRVHIGQAAVKLGLVDDLKSLEQAIAFLTRSSTASAKGKRNMSHQDTLGIDTVEPTQATAGEPLETATLVPGQTADHAGTYDELKAACPGADAEFLCAQLEAKATVDQAGKAWMTEQNKRLEASNKERDEALAKAQPKPGVEAVATTGEESAAGDGNPKTEWDDAVQAEIDRGKNHAAAVRAVVHKDPGLHQRYIDAAQSQPRRE